MGQPIIFFEKNKIDKDFAGVAITVTDGVATNDGATFLENLRDRKNFTAWQTTDSTDAAGTTLEIDYSDQKQISDILLVLHNFKDYTVKYHNGVSFVDFSPAIAVTGNTDDVNAHNFTPVTTSRIQIVISACQVVDADKILRQLIITERIGQLNASPQVRKPVFGTNKRVTRMLSGAVRVTQSIGSYSCELSVENWKDQADLDIIQNIYNRFEGVLLWINANDDDQFSMDLKGYRKQDIFLVQPTDDFTPEFVLGLYKTGVRQRLKFSESNT